MHRGPSLDAFGDAPGLVPPSATHRHRNHHHRHHANTITIAATMQTLSKHATTMSACES